VLSQTLDAFRHGSGRDLTGYEDGTENPSGDAAVEATVVAGRGRGLDGSSFVAVQQWVHDFDTFEAMAGHDQDNAIGRRKSDNEELEDAPESAHVKRTAQESFDPEAFNLRRSMPWTEGQRAGLHFVAFGKSFNAFEAQLNRMVGAEDGVTDALFKFSRPVTGSHFWCPPVEGGRLDLSALGLALTR
jgi:putative iron-dependent peroxidase